MEEVSPQIEIIFYFYVKSESEFNSKELPRRTTYICQS